MRDLSRLLSPQSVAVIGGGAWCLNVIEQLEKFDYRGDIYVVHKTAKKVGGRMAYADVQALPCAPDATFVGINREATIEAIGALRQLGAGGAVCFASGFAEAGAEDARATDLQEALLEQAGAMPFLGPNCYGFINALDGALLWPDQHGLAPVEKGVALLTQSSNIAINLSLQKRGLPIAYIATCGNQAQISQAELAAHLLEDTRVTVIGLHVEGFKNLTEWFAFAQKAAARKIPVLVLKSGRSPAAQGATFSHTASIAGSDAGAGAVIERLGFGRVDDLSVLLEGLKILHFGGALKNTHIASISCSGGEAALIADRSLAHNLHFPPLEKAQEDKLSAELGKRVSLANPLDYHTYIWRDTDKMAKVWAQMVRPANALTVSIVDYPIGAHIDAGDWECAIDAAIGAHQQTGGRFGVVSTLPELMPESVAKRLAEGGVIPLCGLETALAAISACANIAPFDAHRPLPLWREGVCGQTDMLTEYEAKEALRAYGLDIPRAQILMRDGLTKQKIEALFAKDFSYPVVLKAIGLAHKSDMGGVFLDIWTPQALIECVAKLPTDRALVEEMVEGGICEIGVGIVRDPAHGFVLSLSAGGVLVEIMRDVVNLLVPSARADIEDGLKRLKIAPILAGYRGRAGAPMGALCEAIERLQMYVQDNVADIEEIEVNPLIICKDRVVVADALIRRKRNG